MVEFRMSCLLRKRVWRRPLLRNLTW